MELICRHSVHELRAESKHTLNEFEIKVPRIFSPPGHNTFRHVSEHWLKLDHDVQAPNPGQVVGATHELGLTASAIASGSPDSAAASMAGVGSTASVLREMFSSAVSPGASS